MKLSRMKSPRRYIGAFLIPLALTAQLTLPVINAATLQALACGPFFDQTIFATTLHPDMPLKFFARGQLGVLQPHFARSYQVVAYRYLSGHGLNTDEQNEMIALWSSRLTSGALADDGNAPKEWLKARGAVLGGKEKDPDLSDVFRSVGDYSSYLNCPADAFKTASATLARLVSKYGAQSQICKDWIAGQDAVFCHCHEPQYDYKANKKAVEPGFPAKLPDSAALELRQDRQYQMAAAYFYARKLDDALSIFSAIAQDKTSVWQSAARYMVARTLVRQGTLNNPKGIEKGPLTQALTSLKQLAADPAEKIYAASIANLIGFIDVRLNPAQASQNLAREIVKPTTAGASNFASNVDSYLFVLDRLFGYDSDGDADSKLKVVDAAAIPLMRSEEMTDWIWCFSSTDPAEKSHAAALFKTHHNVLWAIAYAAKMDGTEAGVNDVLAVLAKVAKADPAYLTASYHHARLLFATKREKEAQLIVAAALAQSSLPPSTSNLFNQLRLPYADSLEQFLALTIMPPALVCGGYSTGEMPDDVDKVEKNLSYKKYAPVLMPEAAVAVNTSFPLTSFVAAATSAKIAAPYGGQFAQAAFIRAVILGDYATAAKMSPLLKKSFPAMSALLADFEKASTPQDKDFAAAFLILKYPGLRPAVTGGTGRGTAVGSIDDYQDNWWSKESVVSSGDRGGDSGGDVKPQALKTLFLSGADQALGKIQTAKVVAAGDAPNYLGKIVIAYAQAHHTDPRVPEALALTVKATHLGSSDEAKTTRVSTQAFQILHASFVGNPWTKKTPYHY